MPTRYFYLCLAALLASSALSAPHDENAPRNHTLTDQQSPTVVCTTTVFVTVTVTSYITGEPSPAISLTQSSPGSAVPQPSDSVSPPSGTTSLILPSFTYDPLPTSMASVNLSANGTMTTETLAMPGIPTSAMSTSTTCSHTMSHIVPSSPLGSLTLPTSTFSNLPISNSGPSTPVVPVSSLSEFNWPTQTAITPGSSTTTSPSSASVGTSSPIPPPETNTTPTAIATSSSESTASVHPRCKARSAQASNAKAPIKARDTATGIRNISDIQPSTFGWKTTYINTSASRGMINAMPSSKTMLAEESKASKRRMSYWSRFFAMAEPSAERAVTGCLACDRVGEVTCLPNRQYTWCMDGCAITDSLGCDMVCEDGVIRKAGEHCVR